MSIFDEAKIMEELDRQFARGKKNLLSRNACIVMASGVIHEQLSAIVHKWRSHKNLEFCNENPVKTSETDINR